MIDLESRIEEIKSNLVSKNFKYIIKCKYKTIPAKEKDIYNEEKLKEYNYYVKLIKKVEETYKGFKWYTILYNVW